MRISDCSSDVCSADLDMSNLNGKTAVITGGATGIGMAAAKRFIEDGAFVFIFGRRQAALDAAVAELGPNARAVRGSISDPADLDRLYAQVTAEQIGRASGRERVCTYVYVSVDAVALKK